MDVRRDGHINETWRVGRIPGQYTRVNVRKKYSLTSSSSVATTSISYQPSQS